MTANSYDPSLPRFPRDPESPLYMKWGRYPDKDWLPPVEHEEAFRPPSAEERAAIVEAFRDGL